MNIIIIGGGQVGSYIGQLMIESGNLVRIVENRAYTLSKLEKEFPTEFIIKGNGADPRVLEQAGIVSAEVVACVTGADEVNLVSATIAKFEFGVERVLARVNNPKNAWLFNETMGVDVKINQASLLATIIADQIDMENLTTLMTLNQGDSSIVSMTISQNSHVINQSIKDLELPVDIILISIERNGERLIPRGDTSLQAGDHILAYTTADQEKILCDRLR